MTTAERALLELLASIIAPVCRAKPEIEAILTTVRAEWLADPQPIAQRARFVRVEDATTRQVLRCDGCGDGVKKTVRIGEYFDPSFAVCATCISEAAALLSSGRFFPAVRLTDHEPAAVSPVPVTEVL